MRHLDDRAEKNMNTRRARCLGCLITITVTMLAVPHAAAETIAIENAAIRAAVDSGTGALTMRHRKSDVKFVEAVEWPGARKLESVRREERQSTRWGAGQGVVLRWTDGSQAMVTLYERLPFAVVEDVVVNSKAEDMQLSGREFARFDIAVGKPLDQCSAFGTFGLNRLPNRNRRVNRGSYNHLAIADPASRNGVVMAWLTSERATGALFYDYGDDKLRVTARQDYGQFRVKPHEPQVSETFLVGFFADARLGLEAYANAARDYYDIHLPLQPSVYCTWYHARASDENQIRRQTDFAAEHLEPFGFSVIQIDDKWQDGVSKDGPLRIFTRVRPDGPYPGGMQATADYIKQRGLTPGLWYMPFAGTSYDPYFSEMQHLFALQDGKPFEVKWGGTCLDLTHPEAQDFVGLRTRTICRDWGYKYIKIDGLWTGMAAAIAYINEGYKEDNFGEAKLSNPDMTHVEAYRIGMKIVRDTAGKDVFILGCNLAQNMRILGPSIGFVDAMRIGPDNKAEWSQMTRGPFSGSNLYFLHGRVWYNDPDPVYVRPKVPLVQAQALLSWVTLTGQLHSNSFYYADLPPERFDLLKRAIPSHNLLPRPVDLFDERTPRIWLLEDNRRGTPFYLVGLFNWSDKDSADLAATYERIGLPRAEKYVTFDYWANNFGELEGDALDETVKPASCRILAVRPAADHPQLISTSRHITQGVVDVIEESWDGAAKTLRGASRVVGGDPYELRIAKPAGGELTLTNVNADASIQIVGEEQLGWRVRIDSPANRDVKWALRFE
jgi:hypothetical protein